MLTTFDILRHYAALPDGHMEDIVNIIDDVSNGLLLELHSHRCFDNFWWSLKATDVCFILSIVRLITDIYPDRKRVHNSDTRQEGTWPDGGKEGHFR